MRPSGTAPSFTDSVATIDGSVRRVDAFQCCCWPRSRFFAGARPRRHRRHRRSVLRRSGARDGRVGRLAHAALQLRAALSEAGPLLLADGGASTSSPARPSSSARLWSALAGVGLVLVIAACGRRWFDEDDGPARRRDRRDELWLLRARAHGAARICRSPSSSRWRSGRRSSPRSSASAIPAAGCCWRPPPPRLGFLMKGPLALVIPALVVVPILLIERRSFNVRVARRRARRCCCFSRSPCRGTWRCG